MRERLWNTYKQLRLLHEYLPSTSWRGQPECTEYHKVQTGFGWGPTSLTGWVSTTLHQNLESLIAFYPFGIQSEVLR